MKYKINPFVETNKITDGVWHMVSPGFGVSYMYLIRGSDRALLIDTGFGVGNLKGLVGELTELPVDVVNTHGHGDHMMGNYQFDSVYIHEDDLEDCKKNDLPENRARMATPPDFSKISSAQADPRVPPLPKEYYTQYTAADVVPVRPYRLVPIRSGFTFDLGGGYIIEVIEIPGHTPGSICLLDRKRRLLFSGDAVVYSPTFIFSAKGEKKNPKATVESYRESLLKLKERAGEFDGIYAGHSVLNMPPSIITEKILCCEDIMADNGIGEDFNFMGMKAKVHYHGKGAIAFSLDKIYKNR